MSLTGLMVMALVLMPSIPAVYADAQESSGVINLDGIVTQDSLTHETPQAGGQLVNSVMETMRHENVITVLPNGNLFQQQPESGFEGHHLDSMTPHTQMNAVVQNVMESIRPMVMNGQAINEHSPQVSHISGVAGSHVSVAAALNAQPSPISVTQAYTSIQVPNSLFSSNLRISPEGTTLGQALTALRENGIAVPQPPRGILAVFWAQAIINRADQLGASVAPSVSVPTSSEISVPVPEPTPSETPAPPAE